jgi:predicted nucleic acid-binding protein
MSRFADTSYLLALLIPDDQYHVPAVVLATGWRGKLVTTDFVLVEAANHLSPRQSRNVFARFARAIAAEVDALTADHHFTQAGFNILMNSTGG